MHYSIIYLDPIDPGKFGQMIAMVNITDGKMAPFPGGILLKSKTTGEIVGAVGVSGAASDEDESCALNGAALAAEFLTTE